MKTSKTIVGWQEWCALHALDLPAIKVKVDTGAKTSSLHAFNIETFEQAGQHYARFDIHPIQRSRKIRRQCTALLIDERAVKSSSGHEEKRYVVATPITLFGKTWEIHITLTDRDAMGMRMLLGREAMRGRIIVDPAKSFLHGKLSPKAALAKYSV